MSAEPSSDPILSAALEYASLGWAIFPTGGPGQTIKDPHPRAGRWSKTSTSDPQAVADLFTGLEGPVGIGLDCGKSGLVALDVDHPDKATQTILDLRGSAWEHQGNRERWTLVLRQDGGIKCPPQSWGEVKGAGGYIVLAPSPHPSGVEYRWTRRVGPQPTLIPQALEESLLSRGQAANEATVSDVQAFMDTRTRADRPGALGGPLAALRKAAASGAGLHPAMPGILAWAMEEADAGLYAARLAADTLEQAWLEAYVQQGRQARPDHRSEWAAMVRWAVGQALEGTPEESEGRRQRLGLVAVAVLPEPEIEEAEVPRLPISFWGERKSLEHVRQAARSRAVGPDGLLLACLVRVACSLDPAWYLPPIVVAEASANLFGALVIGSGGGKSGSMAVAADLIPLPQPSLEWIDTDGNPISNRGAVKVVNMGTGEGIVEALGRKEGKTWLKGTHSLLVSADEIDSFMGSLSLGAATSGTLRSIYSGGALGATQRSVPTPVAAHDHRIGLLVGAQPERCSGLMTGKEAHGGTPQRFIWLTALVDEDLNEDNYPDWPGPLGWSPWVGKHRKTEEVWGSRQIIDSHGEEVTIYGVKVAEQVAKQVRRDHLTQVKTLRRGNLDGHANQNRLKVALALGLLERGSKTPQITEEDWTLAGIVMETSDGIREWITEQSAQAKVAEAVETARVRKSGEREADQTVQRVAGVLERALVKHGPQTHRALRKRLASKDRGWQDDSLAWLVQHGRAGISGQTWQAVE